MTSRFNLELAPDAKNVVADLMQKTGLRTQTDVFEYALALFAWSVREVGRGRVITSLDEQTKQYGELQMPPLMAVADARAKASTGLPAADKPRPTRKARDKEALLAGD